MAANFSFTKLVKELSEEGITFADKQLKWNTAADGLFKNFTIKAKIIKYFL